MYVGAAWHHEIIMISKTTTNVTITALVIGVALNFTHRLLPSGYILHLCIITLPTTWLFGWPHKRSAYRLHLQTLVHRSSLLQYLVTYFWLHFYNHGSKSIRTSAPQNCTETNLDMEWQGVNNDGNFEQGPIAEKGTVFVVLNFCKSDHRPACEWYFIFCNSQCEARLTCFHAFLQCICFSTD